MAVAAVAAMAVTSCVEVEDSGKKQEIELNENLTLTVEIDNVTSTTAKVKVTHDGLSSDSWFGILTSDVDTNEQEIINSAVDKFVADGASEGLHKSKSYVSVLKELEPQTSYKYIAFGLTEDGVVYGNSASYEFITEAEQSSGGNEGDNDNDDEQQISGSMRVNSAWSVRYIGAGELHEQKFDHIVEVKSTDNNPYVVTIVYASEWNPLFLPELGNALIVDLKEYLAYFNQAYNTNYTLNDMLYRGDGQDAFNLDPGYYKAVAIGVNGEGNLTNLYAVSETFEVKEPIATDAYKAWLGNWKVTGRNNLTSDILVTTKVANKSFYMLGWSGVSDWSVAVDYNAELDSMFFYSQIVAYDFNLGDYGIGDIYFLAGDDEGYFYQMSGSGYGIAIGGILDDGARAIVQYGVGVTDYPSFDKMFFMAKIGNDYYDISMSQSPTYPCIMEPIEEPTTTSRMGLCSTSLKKPTQSFKLTPHKW